MSPFGQQEVYGREDCLPGLGGLRIVALGESFEGGEATLHRLQVRIKDGGLAPAEIARRDVEPNVVGVSVARVAQRALAEVGQVSERQRVSKRQFLVIGHEGILAEGLALRPTVSGL